MEPTTVTQIDYTNLLNTIINNQTSQINIECFIFGLLGFLMGSFIAYIICKGVFGK